MLLYSFVPTYHAHNVQKCNRYTEFEYTPFTNNHYTKYYIKLDNNDVYIHDEKLNFKYKGRLDLQESRYYPEIKLVYNLDSSINFIGGLLILEKNNAQLVHSGSGLPYLNAFSGVIRKAHKYEV